MAVGNVAFSNGAKPDNMQEQKYGSKSIVLSQKYAEIIAQTLIEQGLDGLEGEFLYSGKTPIAFLGNLVHTNAGKLGLTGDTQAVIDITLNAFACLDAKIRKQTIITKHDISEAKVQLESIQEVIGNENICYLDNIIDHINFRSIQSLESVSDHMRSIVKEVNFSQSHLFQKYSGGQSRLITHIAGLHLLVPKLQVQKIIPGRCDISIRTDRLNQANDVCDFYLSHVIS